MTYSDQAETLTQRMQFFSAPKKADGSAAVLDGDPILTSNNPTVASAEVDFRHQLWVVAKGIGRATIHVNGTSGGAPVPTESFDIVVSPDPAVTFGLTFAAPIQQ